MERLAEENLKRQGYETYLPLVQQTRRRNGKNIKVTESFFPRYLFIYLDDKTDNWAPIRSTLGVSHLIRFGGEAVVVPMRLIYELKQNENECGFQQYHDNDLMLGDNITVIGGPFAGQQGIYQHKKGTERVAILLDIVGKNTLVTLNVNELQKAEK